MDRSKYEAVLIGIDRDGRWYLNDRSLALLESGRGLPNLIVDGAKEVALAARGNDSQLIDVSSHRGIGTLDALFPILHGPYGEDGTIQGLCKLANIPCVGAGVLGSAVGMDKEVMKRLLRDGAIPIARFLSLRRSGGNAVDFEQVRSRLGLPLFVKPANLGSSVGISKVRNEGEYRKAVDLAFQYDTKVIVEETIDGREIECAVLGNADPIASVPGEIIPSHDFYDYEAKYLDEHGAALEIPARLDPPITEEVKRLAVRSFQLLCCEGMGRVDMILNKSGRLVVNEINTIPGFTRISMYPKLWEASGIPYSELIDRLIALAIERFQTERSLATSPS
jgi:D-alanine-D-alanine ligase